VSVAFVDVCASAEVVEGRPIVARAQGRELALVRVQGRVYAVDNLCPHRAGQMGCGDLDGHHLSCPLHAWVFDVRDGQAFFPKGAKLETFEVREESGRILARSRASLPRP
jgi:nitrite reductase/ring-hydroxylating ferredoxin subunit